MRRLVGFRCSGKFEPPALVGAFKESLRIAVEEKAAKLFHARGSNEPLAAAMLMSRDFLEPNPFGQTVPRNRGLKGITTESEEKALRFFESAGA